MTTYTARVVRNIDNGPDKLNSIEVGVFRGEGDAEEQIGAYMRNYTTLFRSFSPFQKDGRDYALYSPHYTATRVMELPSCRDLGGEEPDALGFCPVEFYVPRYIERERVMLSGTIRRYRVNEPEPHDLVVRTSQYTPPDPETGQRTVVERSSYPVTPLLYYPFGFVAGCVWGDDASWKIQYLDLGGADRGVVRRDARFGYIEMPEHLTLKQAVDMTDYLYDPDDEDAHDITIAVRRCFDQRTGASGDGPG